MTRVAFGWSLPSSYAAHAAACLRIVKQRERELARAVSLSAIAAATARLERARAIYTRAAEVVERGAQRAA